MQFDRNAFVQKAKEAIQFRDNEGFIVGLKRRKEFATAFCEQYSNCNELEKIQCMLGIAVDMNVPNVAIMIQSMGALNRIQLVYHVISAALGFVPNTDKSIISKNVKNWILPAPEKLCILIGSVPKGSLFLIQFRKDVLHVLKWNDTLSMEDRQALIGLDSALKDIFAAQVGVRFLKLDLMQKEIVDFVVKHERVHPFQCERDVVRRVQGKNKKCFALTYTNIGHRPLVFLQLALAERMPCATYQVLADSTEDTDKCSFAVFYSVSNANEGLRGLNLASHLLFLTIEHLTSTHPQCKRFVTLSPVPTFRKWIENDNVLKTMFPDRDVAKLLSNYAVDDEDMKQLLYTLCGHFVLFMYKSNKLYDPVANFHVRNGARIERINLNSNPEKSGIAQSYGIMINYEYDLNLVSQTSSFYKQKCTAASFTNAKQIWGTKSPIFFWMDEKFRNQVQLYAMAFQSGDEIIKRGNTCTSVWFVCMGAVTVQCHQPYEVKAGSSFAELEMLNHEPNRFSVVAKGRCHLFLVTQRDIHHVLKSHPHYRMAIEQYIITSRQPQYDFGKL